MPATIDPIAQAALNAGPSANDKEQEKIRTLKARHPLIQRRLAESQIVDDVNERRILKVPLDAGSSGDSRTMDSGYMLDARDKGERFYIPKGGQESDDDYGKRIRITPFFPQTPDILRDRRGALFSNPPTLEFAQKDDSNESKIREFFNRVTMDGKSVADEVPKSGDHMQSRGFYGIFVDKPRLSPQDSARLRAGLLSQAEVDKRQLNRPYAIMYPPDRLLNYHEDEFGLKWVSVVDYRKVSDGPLNPEKLISEIRVIDRINVTIYEIETDAQGNERIVNESVVRHGVINMDKEPIVPFVIGSSGMDCDNEPIGASLLIEAAESDVTATRLLSLVQWCLVVAGTPILKKWQRNADQGGNVNTNPTTYTTLLVETGGLGREDLEFCQYDPAGLELLIAMWEHFRSVAREKANKTAASAESAPPVKSGVAIAYEFWTDEQRALFQIANSIESAWDRVMDIACLRMKIDPATVKVKFNKQFEMDAPADNFDVAEKILGIAERYNLPTARVQALKKIVKALGSMSDVEAGDLEKEIMATLSAEPPENADDPENPDDPSKNADPGAIPAERVALSLQQLGLAAERAKEQGNEALASKLQAKMDELIQRI